MGGETIIQSVRLRPEQIWLLHGSIKSYHEGNQHFSVRPESAEGSLPKGSISASLISSGFNSSLLAAECFI